MIFQVKSLDVWGNEDDGFTVNQEFNAGSIVCAGDLNCHLVTALIDGGFLKDGCIYGVNVDVRDHANGLIEVNDYKTGEPLYFLTYEE